jgi:archaellum biogenesis ATPase FlaH
MADPINRDTVFVAGGQPSITYIDRPNLEIERELAKAVAMPNQVVSLSGPTKCGKTVLCRRVLRDKQFIWIEGGQNKTSQEIWEKICYELNFPVEIEKGEGSETSLAAKVSHLIFSASGSQLFSSERKRKYRLDSMASALKHMREKNIVLVVDDFHYLVDAARVDFVRNVKGAVFAGLKIVLLSVSHRKFDAIKAESELTGRLISVTVPEWSSRDLTLIPQKGFPALNVRCPEDVVEKISTECQSSPFIMQRLCWDICFDLEVDVPASPPLWVPQTTDLKSLYLRLAKDAGQPIYNRLVAGPQIRKDRLKRPLTAGGEADVYQAVLMGIAETGPTPSISYNELRAKLTGVLAGEIPQKHEVTSVMKQLAKISQAMGPDAGVDWDEDERQIDISDPYLRFFLRWKVRRHA